MNKEELRKFNEELDRIINEISDTTKRSYLAGRKAQADKAQKALDKARQSVKKSNTRQVNSLPAKTSKENAEKALKALKSEMRKISNGSDWRLETEEDYMSLSVRYWGDWEGDDGSGDYDWQTLDEDYRDELDDILYKIQKQYNVQIHEPGSEKNWLDFNIYTETKYAVAVGSPITGEVVFVQHFDNFKDTVNKYNELFDMGIGASEQDNDWLLMFALDDKGLWHYTRSEKWYDEEVDEPTQEILNKEFNKLDTISKAKYAVVVGDGDGYIYFVQHFDNKKDADNKLEELTKSNEIILDVYEYIFDDDEMSMTSYCWGEVTEKRSDGLWWDLPGFVGERPFDEPYQEMLKEEINELNILPKAKYAVAASEPINGNIVFVHHFDNKEDAYDKLNELQESYKFLNDTEDNESWVLVFKKGSDGFWHNDGVGYDEKIDEPLQKILHERINELDSVKTK